LRDLTHNWKTVLKTLLGTPSRIIGTYEYSEYFSLQSLLKEKSFISKFKLQVAGEHLAQRQILCHMCKSGCVDVEMMGNPDLPQGCAGLWQHPWFVLAVSGPIHCCFLTETGRYSKEFFFSCQ